MSTLGTFAHYAQEADFGSRPNLRTISEPIETKLDTSKIFQSPEYLKKKAKIRNIAVASGLGLAGLAGLGAAAYLNRDSRNRRAEMGFGSAFANFAVSAEERAAARAYLESRGFTLKDETPELAAATRKRREEAVKRFTQTGNPEADAIIKKMRGESRKARVKNIADTKAQKLVESNIDAGGDIYKGAKGMEYVTRTGALLGSPERGLIEAGKASKNEFVQNLAKGAEKVGRLGYKPGAGVMNKVVGRTFTGKVARLSGAGLGLSAIGGAMKRNRQEQG